MVVCAMKWFWLKRLTLTCNSIISVKSRKKEMVVDIFRIHQSYSIDSFISDDELRLNLAQLAQPYDAHFLGSNVSFTSHGPHKRHAWYEQSILHVNDSQWNFIIDWNLIGFHPANNFWIWTGLHIMRYALRGWKGLMTLFITHPYF